MLNSVAGRMRSIQWKEECIKKPVTISRQRPAVPLRRKAPNVPGAEREKRSTPPFRDSGRQLHQREIDPVELEIQNAERRVQQHKTGPSQANKALEDEIVQRRQ